MTRLTKGWSELLGQSSLDIVVLKVLHELHQYLDGAQDDLSEE